MQWISLNIRKVPSFEPFLEHIDLIEDVVQSNPALCVETCKSLIEGICKTILTNKAVHFELDIPFQGLVRQTIDAILVTEDNYRGDMIELRRRIASVSQKLGEIRNNAGFVSHGMDVLNPRLTETISTFAYRVTDAIAGFILNCYCNNRVVINDQRIHYSDCIAFNTYFDELYPMNFGIIEISTSEALYKQDYQAYKEAYFSYISDLEDEGLEENSVTA